MVKISVFDAADISADDLRKFAEDNKLSDAALSLVFNTKKKTIRKWIRGKHKIPHAVKLLVFVCLKFPNVLQEIYRVEVVEDGRVGWADLIGSLNRFHAVASAWVGQSDQKEDG